MRTAAENLYRDVSGSRVAYLACISCVLQQTDEIVPRVSAPSRPCAIVCFHPRSERKIFLINFRRLWQGGHVCRTDVSLSRPCALSDILQLERPVQCGLYITVSHPDFPFGLPATSVTGPIFKNFPEHPLVMSAHLARSPSYQGSDPDTKDVAYPDEKEIGVAKVEPVKFSDLNDGVSRDRGLVGKLWQIVEKVDKFGVEARGIERVPPNERGHTSALDNLWMWTAVNCTVRRPDHSYPSFLPTSRH